LLTWLALLLLMVRPLGRYMQRVFNGDATPLSPLCRPVETVPYRLAGVRQDEAQTGYQYAISLQIFHLPGLVVLYVLLRCQARLPLSPANQAAVAPDLSLNNAISFATNTSWQSYGA
jgi:K+-transporting ATPase ATPase A chain